MWHSCFTNLDAHSPSFIIVILHIFLFPFSRHGHHGRIHWIVPSLQDEECREQEGTRQGSCPRTKLGSYRRCPILGLSRIRRVVGIRLLQCLHWKGIRDLRQQIIIHTIETARRKSLIGLLESLGSLDFEHFQTISIHNNINNNNHHQYYQNIDVLVPICEYYSNGGNFFLIKI